MLFHVSFFLWDVMSFDTLDDCVCAFFIIIALRIPVECALWECPTWCLVRFRPFTCIHTVNMHTQLAECHRTSANIYISIISINETWMNLNCNCCIQQQTTRETLRSRRQTHTPHNSCIKFHFFSFPIACVLWMAKVRVIRKKKKCIRQCKRGELLTFACTRLLIIFGCWPHEMRKRKKPLSDSFFISFIINGRNDVMGELRRSKKVSRHFNRKISVISVTWLLSTLSWFCSSDGHHHSTLLIPFSIVHDALCSHIFYCSKMFLLCIIIFRFSASKNHKSSLSNLKSLFSSN